ncbi:GNAT family N-acetyltransferase [Mycolicibacterium llatzerense]|uniref:GNAT family N-acetyltransferase n=1 Tax=Mycolicibacterium llatzerense TaxID=280871 RepID=UPI0008DD48BF|nr:GNAT family N-acetyltransferase [Mycolicibacterium llatzerense]
MKIEQCQLGHVPPTTISSPAQQSRETLWDGTQITVRDLDPEDFPAVMALADNLTGDELYLRFFTYRPRHLAEWAHSVTEPAAGDVALGAFDGEHLLAVGNSVAVDDSGTAEISVVVAHRNHHRGIATALLRRLAEPAKSTGRQRLIAEVDRAYARSTGLAAPEPTASLSATCTAR